MTSYLTVQLPSVPLNCESSDSFLKFLWSGTGAKKLEGEVREMNSCGETESGQQVTSDLELELEVARQEGKPKASETKTCGASPPCAPGKCTQS